MKMARTLRRKLLKPPSDKVKKTDEADDETCLSINDTLPRPVSTPTRTTPAGHPPQSGAVSTQRMAFAAGDAHFQSFQGSQMENESGRGRRCRQKQSTGSGTRLQVDEWSLDAQPATEGRECKLNPPVVGKAAVLRSNGAACQNVSTRLEQKRAKRSRPGHDDICPKYIETR